MNQDDGRSGWQRAVRSYRSMVEGPDIRVGQLVLLWASMVGLIILVCVVFFGVLYWVIG